MDNLFGSNVIYKRVMTVVKSRIKEQQQKYDDGVKELEEQLEKDKVVLADKLVDAILGKIL